MCECLCVCVCHESWPSDLAGFGWCCDQRGVCVIYTSACVCVCVCVAESLLRQSNRKVKNMARPEKTQHTLTHKHVRFKCLAWRFGQRCVCETFVFCKFLHNCTLLLLLFLLLLLLFACSPCCCSVCCCVFQVPGP